jgi:hypothetical protein
MSTVILERNGFTVEAYGEESDRMFQGGQKVAIPERLAQRINRNRDRTQAELNASRSIKQGDEFERIYESGRTLECGAQYDGSSLADLFSIDRSAGWASAIAYNVQCAKAPRMASIVCCSTDVPVVSVERDRKRFFTGFVNLAIATDLCVLDKLAAAEATDDGTSNGNAINMEAELLEEVVAALNEAANSIAISGYAPSNVLGFRNNPYITTVLIDPPSTTNPIISFRRLAQFLELRDRTMITLDGIFTKTYTLMLPIDLISQMASTYVTVGNEQMSALALLTGACGGCASDPSLPKFRIVGMSNLGKWYDGVSDIGYMFAADANSFASSVKWHKPFSFLNLGQSRHGLREFTYFGSRVGSIEITNMNKCIRILIPMV